MINHRPTQSETSSICSEAADICDDKSKGLSINGSTIVNSANQLINEPNAVANMKKGSSKIPSRISVPIRRKSKVERQEELSQMKLEAMNQVENTIKVTEMVKDRDSKLSELQLENINLKNNLRELQRKLEDARNVNTELVDKLFAASNETTQRKIDSENQRTHDLVDVTLSPNASYDRYLKDIISRRDTLQDQNNQLRAELDRSRDQIIMLKDNIDYLESICDSRMASTNTIHDANIDSRSKSELLKLIRSHLDDKMIWMEYAIKLTMSAVEKSPELLRIDKKSFSSKEVEEFCCESEAKWAPFAISLLKKVNESDPSLVQSMISSKHAIPSDLLRSKLKKKKKI